MFEMRAKPFVMAMDQITQLMIYGRDPNVEKFSPELKLSLENNIGDLKLQLQALQMPQSIIVSADRVLAQIKDDYPLQAVSHTVIELRGRMMDEMGGEFLLSLSPQERALFQPEVPLLGEGVGQKLLGSDSHEDIAEAGKCLALGRYTAVVFHLMRAMERALQKAGGILGATIADKNDNNLAWGIIVANLDGKIKALPDGPHKAKWSEARALLYHVGQAWRTPTMHPKQTYTEQEARDIFAATRSFMIRLAELV